MKLKVFLTGVVTGIVLMAAGVCINDYAASPVPVVRAATVEEEAIHAKEEALQLLNTVELTVDDMNALIKLVPYEQSVEIREGLGTSSCSDYIREFINQVPGFAEDFLAYYQHQ